jgi:hypothetical protein
MSSESYLSMATLGSQCDVCSYQTWDALTPVIAQVDESKSEFKHLRDLRPGTYFQLTPYSAKTFMVVDRVKSGQTVTIVSICERENSEGFEILTVNLVSRRNRSKR